MGSSFQKLKSNVIELYLWYEIRKLKSNVIELYLWYEIRIYFNVDLQSELIEYQFRNTLC